MAFGLFRKEKIKKYLYNLDDVAFFEENSEEFLLDFSVEQIDYLLQVMQLYPSKVKYIAYKSMNVEDMKSMIKMVNNFDYDRLIEDFEVWKIIHSGAEGDKLKVLLDALRFHFELVDIVPNISKLSSESLYYAFECLYHGEDLDIKQWNTPGIAGMLKTKAERGRRNNLAKREKSLYSHLTFPEASPTHEIFQKISGYHPGL